MDYNKESLKLHRAKRGKIEIKSKVSLKTKRDLSLAYTPGVGAVSAAIGADKSLSWAYTNRANQVAIVSNGTAVLGLGDLGPEAAMPVMEGKSAIFKEQAGIDAIPLCINSRRPADIIKFVKDLEPSFGGINLEDIAAPECFVVLAALEKELSIPVFHDDQDGTAIVVLAALINAAKLSGRELAGLKIVVNGAGAAGIAIARLLAEMNAGDIILLDTKGAIYSGRRDLNPIKMEISRRTNAEKISGGLDKALIDADVFIGVSKGGLVTAEMVRTMAGQPIVFALANPVPEIMPQTALAGGAGIVGTGRSDLPNQINNALVFPGLFRALLDYKINRVTVEMKIAAAQAIADSIKPKKDKILPALTDRQTVGAIVKALKGFRASGGPGRK